DVYPGAALHFQRSGKEIPLPIKTPPIPAAMGTDVQRFVGQRLLNLGAQGGDMIVSVSEDHKQEVEVGVTQQSAQIAGTAVGREVDLDSLISALRDQAHLFFEAALHSPSSFDKLQFHFLFSDVPHLPRTFSLSIGKLSRQDIN